MRDYSYSELMAMQEEATRRVHEMQQRSRLAAERAQKEITIPDNSSPSKQILKKSIVAEAAETPKIIKNDNKILDESCNSSCKNDCPFNPIYNSPIKNIFGENQKDISLVLTLLLLLGGDDELTTLALIYIMT